MRKVEALYQGQNMLGEGPLWLAGRQQLWWVDILENKVFGFDIRSGEVKQFAFDRPVTLLVETDDSGTLLVAMQGGIAFLDLDSGALKHILSLETDKPNNRTNDGGCDTKGRLWVGTMDKQFETGAGHLYLVDKGEFVPKIRNTTIANGLVWSADGNTMYFIDSPLKAVRKFAYNPDDATLVSQGDVVRITDELGGPDGMAIDEEGMLWVAHYGGYLVGRWNPDTGELLEKIAVPAPNVTACVFGGDDMKTLFITTARQEMTPAELEQYPLSGSLFRVAVNVRGAAKNKVSLEASGLR